MDEPQGTNPSPPPQPIDWPAIGRIVLKAAVLFVLVNLAFAACRPLDTLGRLSLYNTFIPGRERLPYGERPTEDYNLTLNNLPAMLASQAAAQPKADDEFRLLIIGDSGTWGWFLNARDQLAAQLNQLDLQTADGQRIVAYNLGYPVLSLTKDLLVLDQAMAFDPDLIVWPVTLQSLSRPTQLDHPLVQNNADQVRALISDYAIDLDPADPRFVDRTFLEETIVARRRDLADLLRLQSYGLSWAATGIDQAIPDEIPLRATDLKDDLSWLGIESPRELTGSDVTLDVLQAGIDRTGDVPLLIVNEPMFISDGINSDLRYNAFYPRWAYDDFRVMLAETATAQGWNYTDLWDAIAPERFTDTPVHLDAEGTRQFAALLAPLIQQAAE